MSSPSSVSKVKGCARRFALDLFEPYEQGEQARLGDEIHDAADDYHKFGKAPDLTTTAGLVLEAGLPYMPQPRTGTAEGKVRWLFAGQWHNFRMDLNGFVRDLPQHLAGTRPDMPYVLDYKSQTDKGGKEKDQQLWGKAAFLADEEAVLYALRRMEETGSAECYLRWLYLRAPNKEGKLRPKARPSDVIVTWDECVGAYQRMYVRAAMIVDEIYEAKDKKKLTVLSAMSLPPNPHQCTKYGAKYACKHIDKCKLTPEFIAVETSKPEETYMQALQGTDLFAAMQAAMSQPQQAPAAPAPAPQPIVNPLAFMTPGVSAPASAPPAHMPQIQTAPTQAIAMPAMPSSPAFVNPPEAPHVPAQHMIMATGPNTTKDVSTRAAQVPVGLSVPSDEEIGRVVRHLLSLIGR